ncbi:hypothetical protein CYA_0641 [Synechococcus sp. JA-3-3Ab]|nr:hypothetical protein CYA_0641 [Synechococcus sp. JA-3-3Ab]
MTSKARRGSPLEKGIPLLFAPSCPLAEALSTWSPPATVPACLCCLREGFRFPS